MKILLVKAPPSTSVRLEKMKSNNMKFYFGHEQNECIEIAQNHNIDLVIAFMKFPDPELQKTLDIFAETFPEKKIIGLVDDKLSLLINQVYPDILHELPCKKTPYYK